MTVNSMSELSEDIDLEYDLYDCDLNNVSAQPGSMFAHATYFFDDDDDVIDDLMATPTRHTGSRLNLAGFFLL